MVLALRRVADDELEQEAVELGLRERVGAFLLDGVLGRHHAIGLFEVDRAPADGDLLLLHGLEQGRLGLGRGPVDLVGENQVGDQRPFLEGEFVAAAFGLGEHHGALDVRRHHVRCELDAGEGEVDRLAQAPHEQGLAEPRHALEQDVPARHHRGQHAVDDVLLADHHLGDLGLDLREYRPELVGAGARLVC